MAPLRISVYNKSLTRVGILFEFVSLTWEETYNDVGTMQIVVNKSRSMTSVFKMGYFIGIPDSDTLMVITGLEDKQTPEGAELWIHGFEAKYILGNRVFANAHVGGGNVESRLKYLLANKLSIMTIAPSHGLTETTDLEHEYPTLLELCEDFCQPADYGFKLVFDKTNKKLQFDVYNGTTINSVKYSTRYGNLYNLERRKMLNGAKNVAYVLGEKVEGEEREVVCVSLDGAPSSRSSLDRWEMVVDASDIKREEGDAASSSGGASSGQEAHGSWIIVTDEEDQGTSASASYEEKLSTRGLEVLAENAQIDEVVFDVDPSDYRKVFEVGDKITCVLPEYDEVLVIRIVSARVVYEENIRKISLTMGEPIKRRKRG